MKKILIIFMFLISIISIVFVYNDYFLYKTPILSVTSVETINEGDESFEEISYIQHIKGVIKNGEHKGKTYETTNTFLESLVYDDKIETHSELFVELSDDGKEVVSITGIKRDKYVAILLVIFINLIILIAGKKGLQTLFSLLVNIGITAGAIVLFMNNTETMNLLLLFLIVSILYVIISLFITNGRSKKTLAAIVSSIVSLFITFGLSFVLIKSVESDLYIWNIDYIEAVYDYNNYLYVCILLCGLGAIMDISITVSSALNELIMKDNKITKKALIKSGKEISKDIVGTMINVMLFTCYTSIIPTVIVATRNSIPFANAIDFYGNIELMIVLCNCIGIVLTIPVSLFISILILNSNRKDVMKDE
jgi:uncharacterized membrane protein